jgi:intracellular sulfur oxidation DsrE/DsrF family protein
MKKFITMLLLVALIGYSQNSFAQTKKNTNKENKHKKAIKTHKIVMQLTSGEATVHKGLIKQLNNLKAGWGDTVQIEVVCHGPGIDFLTTEKTKFKDEIYQLKAKGVDFVVCENSLREREVPKEAILPEMSYVKMGIGEIVLKQEAGWIYIKAGF